MITVRNYEHEIQETNASNNKWKNIKSLFIEVSKFNYFRSTNIYLENTTTLKNANPWKLYDRTGVSPRYFSNKYYSEKFKKNVILLRSISKKYTNLEDQQDSQPIYSCQ